MFWFNLFYLCLSLLAIAEETLAEFLSKATGTAVDWVQMIGMKVSLLNLSSEICSEFMCMYALLCINVTPIQKYNISSDNM